jgi:5,6-dimethylbenzimidazole synthase
MNVYEAIHSRRDVRRFRPDPVSDDVLVRILDAAHHAGSVGFMQPWNFLVVRSHDVRRKVFEIFEQENARAAENYAGDRRSLYNSLKLQGVLDAPLNLVVTCDRGRGGPHVLGRNTIVDTDVYSTCCAIQNLWIAARAEGVGVGWVSIFDPAAVKELLNIPEQVLLVGYLCVGYPVEFDDRPMLEKVAWADRLPLRELVFEDSWGRKSETVFRD